MRRLCTVELLGVDSRSWSFHCDSFCHVYSQSFADLNPFSLTGTMLWPTGAVLATQDSPEPIAEVDA